MTYEAQSAAIQNPYEVQVLKACTSPMGAAIAPLLLWLQAWIVFHFSKKMPAHIIADPFASKIRFVSMAEWRCYFISSRCGVRRVHKGQVYFLPCYVRPRPGYSSAYNNHQTWLHSEVPFRPPHIVTTLHEGGQTRAPIYTQAADMVDFDIYNIIPNAPYLDLYLGLWIAILRPN